MRSGGTPRARELGAALRQARQSKQLTLKQVADALGRHESHASRWETGKLVPSAEDLGALLQILDIRGDERERIIQLAREIDSPDWVAPGIDKQLAALIETERIAREITIISPNYIPGLLQTEEYAFAIISSHGGNPGNARHDTLLRIGRQAILSRRQPPRLVCAIGETALRYPFCDASIMVEQLDHILKAAQQPNITVVVVPNQVGHYSPLIFGQFVFVDTIDGKPMVQLDSFWSSTTLSNPTAINAYRSAATAIVHSSLGAERSATLIAEIMHELESKA